MTRWELDGDFENDEYQCGYAGCLSLLGGLACFAIGFGVGWLFGAG